MHLRTSALHNQRSCRCLGLGCGRSFVSHADLTLHYESGTCPSGATRRVLNDFVVRSDRNNVVTNPARLIAGPSRQPEVVSLRATVAAWNGYAFECILCHKNYHSLPALNAHLNSPAHADKIFRCPTQYNGCNTEFSTLSGLLQHVERSSCGVTMFQRQIRNVMDNVTQGMNRQLTV